MAFAYLGDFLSWLTGLHIYVPLPMFGLLVATAIYIAIGVIRKDVARKGLNAEMVTDYAMFSCLCGVFGARLFHILENPQEFASDPWGMIFSRGGFSIYGGWVIGTIGGIWYLRRKKVDIFPMADSSALGMCLGYAIGRLGCQISGDGDWGMTANMALKPDWLPTWAWAQTYDGNVVGEVIPAPGVYPTPLYEAVVGFMMFAIMWRFRKHNFQAGWLFALFLVLTGIPRFLVEKIRINPKYDFLGLRFTQAELVSVVFILVGLAGMIWLGRRNKKPLSKK